MTYSYATERKIRIIEEKAGKDWADTYPNQSIDAIYNKLVGDTRKNLFCKIESSSKDHLDTLTEFYDTGMADFIQQLIETAWESHVRRTNEAREALTRDFSG